MIVVMFLVLDASFIICKFFLFEAVKINNLFFRLFGQPLCNAVNSQKLNDINRGLTDKKIFSILMDSMSQMNNKIDKEGILLFF